MYASSTIPEAMSAAVNKQQNVIRLIDAFLLTKNFNGAVLVAKNGEVILTNGYGESNFATHEKNNAETIFRIGSLTKSFTAVAVMQLVEQGKLTLDDQLRHFIPDIPNGDKITIHHLLSHTSGISDAAFFDSAMKDLAGYYSQTKKLETAMRATDNLASEPGTKHNYTNTGYHLLGLIIEQVSHTSWDNYVNEHIIKPTHMPRTGVDINEPILQNRAIGTDANGNTAIFMDMSYASSAGGLYSTVGDLLKFDQALISGKLVNTKSFEMMITPVEDGYGYGWVDGIKMEESSNWKFHNGDIPGFHAFNAFNINENIQVILLTNKEIGPKAFSLDIAKGILNIIAKDLDRGK
ncbi:serine hydrolase domain-containing protein [Paenibacillus aestuarii]|uniref:Serine hydrolase domain-containing protein n=1 Tax=Paenibacillus aestuarii TaxID=516965 RepID=A0ABW0KB00_9BACL|nr:serine hydrolase [Paenibacillus aestuarii]